MPTVSKLRDFLCPLTDLGAKPQQDMHAVDFTLERMQALMDELGHPERLYACLHIAGTNGKGSVAAFCAAALQAQGYKVGSFTSPHLAGALAGIRIHQEAVSDEDLEETFSEMLPHLQKRQDWTQFEVVTVLMFLHFARAKVSAAVIEVGLGGRLDATNVLTPLVTVITPIDYDHTSILGNSLAEIAREKAGIIKQDVPLVMAPQPKEAKASILKSAQAVGVKVIEVGKDVLFECIRSDLTGQVFQMLTPSLPLTKGKGASPEKLRLKIGLLGKHQVENAVTAFAALRIANQRGLVISDDAIRRGFAAARWPGRFEVVAENPPIVLDAAHTPAAARALRIALDEYFPGRPVIMVLGVSADKDLPGIMESLRGRVVRAIATQSAHPRAMPAAELRAKLIRIGIESEAITDVKESMERALDMAKTNEIVLVCGSVFLVEMAKDIFHKAFLIER